uniref:Mitochondrial import inner membrane translocase subunit n=1 Tax=Brassica campestris TaxID=3711 RepID=A0A3P5YSS3_BRACM|nr:unnamed protein product [Brassica rapa]
MAAPSPIPAGISKEQVRIPYLLLLLLITRKAQIFDLVRQLSLKLHSCLCVNAFSMAQTEMEYRVELFNKLLRCTMYNFDISFDRSLLAQTCFVKCVDKRYKEAELNMGENSCIDRCVSKYWQVNGMVGQLLSAGKPPQ